MAYPRCANPSHRPGRSDRGAGGRGGRRDTGAARGRRSGVDRPASPGRPPAGLQGGVARCGGGGGRRRMTGEGRGTEKARVEQGEMSCRDEIGDGMSVASLARAHLPGSPRSGPECRPRRERDGQDRHATEIAVRAFNGTLRILDPSATGRRTMRLPPRRGSGPHRPGTRQRAGPHHARRPRAAARGSGPGLRPPLTEPRPARRTSRRRGGERQNHAPGRASGPGPGRTRSCCKQRLAPRLARTKNWATWLLAARSNVPSFFNKQPREISDFSCVILGLLYSVHGRGPSRTARTGRPRRCCEHQRGLTRNHR